MRRQQVWGWLGGALVNATLNSGLVAGITSCSTGGGTAQADSLAFEEDASSSVNAQAAASHVDSGRAPQLEPNGANSAQLADSGSSVSAVPPSGSNSASSSAIPDASDTAQNPNDTLTSSDAADTTDVPVPSSSAVEVEPHREPASHADFAMHLANSQHTSFIEDDLLVPPLRLLWTASLDYHIGQPLVVKDRIYVPTYTEEFLSVRVVALDRDTGSLVWSTDLAEQRLSTLSYDNGRVFVVGSSSAAEKPALLALDAVTGAVIWQVESNDDQPLSAPSVAYDGKLYVSTVVAAESLELFVYDQSSGALLWNRAFPGGAPSVGPEGIFGGDSCGNVMALSATGDVLWQKQTEYQCYPSSDLAVFDQTLYVTSQGESRDRYDTATGDLLGSFESRYPPALGHGFEVDIESNLLRATSLSAASEAWNFSPEGRMFGSALVVGNVLYTLTTIGSLYALDVETGRVLWSDNYGAPVSSGVFAAARGVLVFPVGSELIAYGSGGTPPEVRNYGGETTCPWSLRHAPDAGSAQSANALVVADFNNDSKPDIAMPSWSSFGGGGVAVSLGVGDGTFSYVTEGWGFSNGTQLLAAADLDRDGVVDLVSGSTNEASDGRDNFQVMRGNGDGTFDEPTKLAIGLAPVAVALEDLDGKNGPDLVVVDNGEGVRVLLNNGNAAFAPQALYAAVNLVSLVVGDVNGDDKSDLVLGRSDPENVLILLGEGDGTFGAASLVAEARWPSALALADLDANGTQDLVVAAGKVQVFTGQGDGTFTLATTLSAGTDVTSLTVGDIDVDGVRDLVLANGYYGGVRVFFGKGDATFVGRHAFGVEMPHFPTITDFDADGLPDIGVYSGTTSQVSILLGACATE